jgi:pyruvate dehydrogenase E2 component (dihydrolipoamide acetyltransferase)
MTDVFMPRLSDTMEEGTISRWVKQEGDTVARGEVLAEIDTDKTTMDLEAYEDGVLERQLVAEGQTVPIGEPIAVIGNGSQVGTARPQQAEKHDGGGAPAAAPAPAAAAPEPAAGPAPAAAAGQVLRSPLARKIAREHHIDLAAVRGTGPGGRVVRADVEEAIASGQQPEPGQHAEAAEAAAAPPAPAAVAGAADTEVKLNANQRITAQRLGETTSIPTFQLTVAIAMDRLLAFRKDVNARLAEAGTRISVTDLLIRAAAVALRRHPAVNASWGGDRIIRHGGVHVGIAVALDEGLIVPVIRDADRKSVGQISAEAAELAARARAGKLRPEEFKGSTFSISNLGMLGVESFTAILNPPEAAILAVGTTGAEVVVIEGAPQTRQVMRVTLTVDHRVLNGAAGAAFLQDLKALLEEPLRIVI